MPGFTDPFNLPNNTEVEAHPHFTDEDTQRHPGPDATVSYHLCYAALVLSRLSHAGPEAEALAIYSEV